jgi:hypothetical protein
MYIGMYEVDVVGRFAKSGQGRSVEMVGKMASNDEVRWQFPSPGVLDRAFKVEPRRSRTSPWPRAGLEH